MFFSVPYENGWSATVNGEEAEIYKTNVGFMSVIVPSGDEVRIAFSYTTPGLFIGTVVSVLALTAFIAYMLLARFSKKKPAKARRALRIPGKLSAYSKKENATFKIRTKNGFLRQRILLRDKIIQQ